MRRLARLHSLVPVLPTRRLRRRLRPRLVRRRQQHLHPRLRRRALLVEARHKEPTARVAVREEPHALAQLRRQPPPLAQRRRWCDAPRTPTAPRIAAVAALALAELAAGAGADVVLALRGLPLIEPWGGVQTLQRPWCKVARVPK